VKLLQLGRCGLIAFAAFPAAARPRIVHCDYNGGRVCVVSTEGRIEWEYACKAPQDCWRLPNGNYLVAYASGAAEITHTKRIAWGYRAPEKVEVHACQPLPNGNVLVVEGGTSRIVEVDRAGRIAKEIRPVTAKHRHPQPIPGYAQDSGRPLLRLLRGEGKVVELDRRGRVLRESGRAIP
jgi:hypothetical protein